MSNERFLGDKESIKTIYKKGIGKKILFLVILFFLIILTVGIASSVGPANISIFKAYQIIIDNFFINNFSITDMERNVVLNIRLPRIIMGFLAGFILGISGSIMQALLKNPLASPYTLGISASSGFGAALAIVLGVGIIGGKYLIIGNAFVFSMLCSMLILGLTYGKNITHSKIILSGVALMYLFQAGITLLEYFAEPYALQSVVFWLVGDLGKASWEKIIVVLVAFLFSTPIFIASSWNLNVMSTGDDDAKSLGVNVTRTKIGLITIVCLITACVVSFVGTIGFIGLVSPHIVRMIIGNDYRYSLIGAGLAGSLLLMISDIVSLVLLQPIVLPIGVITSFMGVPLLLYLVLKRYKRGAV
jgi:iron complex transport system permease protein